MTIVNLAARAKYLFVCYINCVTVRQMNRLVTSISCRSVLNVFNQQINNKQLHQGRHASRQAPTIIKNVSHVIFDMDGLILDTEHIYEAVVRDIAKSYNKEYPHDVRMKIMGTTEQMTVKIAVEDLKLPITVDEFHRKFSDMCRQRFYKLDLLRGAKRFINHLHQHRIPFCLATSSSQEMAEIKMSSHQELFDLFNHKVMGSSDPDVKNGKPAPDIFLVAASRFHTKPDPSECLVFEDAPNGVRAALDAGMQSVMVPDKIVKEEQRRDATIVLESLEHLKPEVFGLPPFK